MAILSGLSIYARQQALSAVLPNATNRYVGLLTALPSVSDGTGLAEVDTATGYTRIAHDAWLNVTDGDEQIRKNDGGVTFPVLVGTLTGVVGWAVWDAASSGHLIAFGPMTDDEDNPTTVNLEIGQQPQLADQELHVTIGEP